MRELDDPYRVLMLGVHPYPHGNASANRMLTLAQTLQTALGRTLVISDDPRLTSSAESPPVLQAGGVDYLCLGAPSANRWERSRRRKTMVQRILESGTVDPSSVETVAMNSIMFLPRFERDVRSAFPSARLISDIVEEYGVAQHRLGPLDPLLLRNRISNWHSAKSSDGVVVISSALAEKVSARRSE